ncbi:MAG: hypothetical protein G01um101491_405 [Parcubacteria group bacterium Gr01-1014_91]|nr:MAG: hypothetical protein G01um101491_405 [Parcubacteria group bacterium Gr01-1014_91]
MKRSSVVALAFAAAVTLAGCENDARVASRNLSQAADMFEIDRRVVFYNGINGEWILSIEGRCSIQVDRPESQLEVTCKIGPSAYKKHFLGLSDNVTYFAEQLESANASVYHYRVIFKPQTILPDVDFRGKASELMGGAEKAYKK